MREGREREKHPAHTLARAASTFFMKEHLITKQTLAFPYTYCISFHTFFNLIHSLNSFYSYWAKHLSDYSGTIDFLMRGSSMFLLLLLFKFALLSQVKYPSFKLYFTIQIHLNNLSKLTQQKDCIIIVIQMTFSFFI